MDLKTFLPDFPKLAAGFRCCLEVGSFIGAFGRIELRSNSWSARIGDPIDQLEGEEVVLVLPPLVRGFGFASLIYNSFTR